MPKREIKVTKRKDVPPPPPQHRFYFTFNDLKSAALALAREIKKDDGDNTAEDVIIFINAIERKR